MRSHLRAEPIINAKRDTPYNMKTQKEIGLLGEKVCRNFLIDCCAKHRFGFVRFEDVRDVKMYQERDIDFIVYTSSGKTITLDAKADTYTTGNIFLEIYVPGFKLGKNGVPLKELRYDNTGIINKDTTIVMLGDCRNNKNYSGVEEVEWLSKRASNFFVLNPDPLNKWGQGDSIADLYAKSGATVCRVSSTQDLLTFLESASLRKQA